MKKQRYTRLEGTRSVHYKKFVHAQSQNTHRCSTLASPFFVSCSGRVLRPFHSVLVLFFPCEHTYLMCLVQVYRRGGHARVCVCTTCDYIDNSAFPSMAYTQQRRSLRSRSRYYPGFYRQLNSLSEVTSTGARIKTPRWRPTELFDIEVCDSLFLGG